jgi:hypothetical protein
MKMPRDILFEKYSGAIPALNRAREKAVEQVSCLFQPSAVLIPSALERRALAGNRQDACSTLTGRVHNIFSLFWTELFLPARRVWLGLALTWVFIFGAGLALSLDMPVVTSDNARPSQEMARVLEKQRIELAKLIQGDAPELAEPVEPPRSHLQPRSCLKPAMIVV